MIDKIKKHWVFVIAFLIINFIVLNIALIFSEPLEAGDLFAPMVLVFGIIAVVSCFFAAVLVSLALSSKTSDFREMLGVIIFSAVLFSFVGVFLNFFAIFSLSQADWEQGFLDATLSAPFDFTMEQFRTLTFFDAIKQSFVVLVQNTGSAFFGLVLARKLMRKKG